MKSQKGKNFFSFQKVQHKLAGIRTGLYGIMSVTGDEEGVRKKILQTRKQFFAFSTVAGSAEAKEDSSFTGRIVSVCDIPYTAQTVQGLFFMPPAVLPSFAAFSGSSGLFGMKPAARSWFLV